jgi:hypothetical protein
MSANNLICWMCKNKTAGNLCLLCANIKKINIFNLFYKNLGLPMLKNTADLTHNIFRWSKNGCGIYLYYGDSVKIAINYGEIFTEWEIREFMTKQEYFILLDNMHDDLTQTCQDPGIMVDTMTYLMNLAI